MAETTKTYTEREVIDRERMAWMAGMERGFVEGGSCPCGSWPGTAFLPDVAREEYPFPKVKRARFVADPHTPGMQWYIHRGSLAATFGGHAATPTPARVAMWADLLANPTELREVEDDGSAAASPEGR